MSIVTFTIEAADLVQMVRFYETVPRKTPAALSKALNRVGDDVRKQIDIGLEEELRIVDTSGIVYAGGVGIVSWTPSTPSKLLYQIVVHGEEYERRVASRRLPERGFPGARPRIDEDLVTVQTSGDDRVCPVCEAIADNGPYTAEEARQNIHHGAGIGLNGCRCFLMPYVSQRRAPMRMETITGSTRDEPGLLVSGTLSRVDMNVTVKDLAKHVLDEMKRLVAEEAARTR
jgi:hypothetical protein